MQIKHAVEVADLLRHNLVQGSREQGNEDAKWGMFLLSQCQHLFCEMVMRDADMAVTELRIHDEIERGDNDSIKVGGKSVKVDKPCSAQ